MAAYHGGAFLIYMGHLTPGKEIGEVIAKKVY
jgi:hypothetical protein